MVYIGSGNALRRVGADGIIATIAGGNEADSTEDGAPARDTAIGSLQSLSMGPDKNLYLFDSSTYSVKTIGTSFTSSSGADEIAITDSDNEEIYVFDSSGRHLRTIDVWSNAVLWEFDYDADGNLITVRDVDGDETQIERVAGDPTAITSPAGQRTELAVNVECYLASISDPENNAYQFTYSAGDGLLTKMTTPNGHDYAFEYNGNGRLVKDANPAGGYQTLERSRLTQADGFKVDIATKMGRVTTYETQELPEGGMKAIKRYPFGLEKELIWSPDSSRLITYVDGTVIELQQAPDPRFGMQIPLPELLRETIPSGLQRNLSLERDVQPGTITDLIHINDRTYTNIFNEVNKSFTLTTPEGRQKVVAINDQARVAAVQSGTLAPVSFTYDSSGKATAITIGSGADQRTFQFSYTNGFLSSMTDPLGYPTSFQRDSAGRIISKMLPDGRSIGFTYDANGNVVSVTPPGRPAHALTYTAIDNLSAYDPPDAGFSPDVTTISYNDDGQITGVVRPGGSRVAIGYDAGGRAASFTLSPGHTTTLSYDPTHAQLTGLSTSDGVGQSLTWDGFLQTGETWSGPVAGSVEVSYNDYFQVDGMRVNGGSRRDFLYDNDGLLIAAENLSMVRDENGLITATAIDATISRKFL